MSNSLPKPLLYAVWLLTGMFGGHMLLLKRWAAATLYWIIILATNFLEVAISEDADKVTTFILLGLWIYDAIWLRVNNPGSARHPPSEKLEVLFSKISAHFKSISDEAEVSAQRPSTRDNQPTKKSSYLSETADSISPDSEVTQTSQLACQFYIELPGWPLEDLDGAKTLASEIEEFDLSIQETLFCINQEGEEVSILLGTNTLPIDDNDSLNRLRDLSLREEVPVVLFTQAAPSYRKGFWPDEDDDWLEQTRNIDWWKEHLEELALMASTITPRRPSGPDSEVTQTSQLACQFYIELPGWPLEDLDGAKTLASEIEEFDLSIQETLFCINQEGEEVSILLGTNTLPIDDNDSLNRLRDLSLREEVPVVLFTQAAPSYRKGFWPDEDDDWLEQKRNIDWWKEHLEELASLSDSAGIAPASSATKNITASDRSLQDLINETQEKFEDAFIELENPWRENVLPSYCEKATMVSFGIGLFAENNSQFGISVHMYLEDWDTGEPIAFSDAVDDKEALIDNLTDVAFSDIAALANSFDDAMSPRFPRDIAKAFNREEGPYEYSGCKIYWNDEPVVGDLLGA